MKLDNDKLTNLRAIGIIEGVSYIILLFMSMPIKYFGNIHWPVKVNGWIHGVLFVTYGIYLLAAWYKHKWTFKKFIVGGIASLIPFGTFWFDGKIAEYKKEL